MAINHFRNKHLQVFSLAANVILTQVHTSGIFPVK
jgi:hypothetical protein